MRSSPPTNRRTRQPPALLTRRTSSRKLQKRSPSAARALSTSSRPARPGWRYSTEKSVEIGKLAVKSGMWVLDEREYGKLTIGAQSKAAMKKPVPLEDYLAPQGRFKGIDPKTVEILKQRIAKNLAKLAAEEAAP